MKLNAFNNGLLTMVFLTFLFCSGMWISKSVANEPAVKLECPFEGGECPNPGCSQNTCREYQYDISAEGTTIYDGNRRVGFLPYDSTQALDKLMLWDNQ